MTYVPIALRRLVSERAGYRCEYCLLPEEFSSFPHEADHITPLKHGGATTADNLWRVSDATGSKAVTWQR